MIKLLTKGGTDLGSIQRHLAYIGRKGDLHLETDDGEQLKGKGIEKDLLQDWDLDLDTYRRQLELSATNRRKPAKLVHKLIFSMPAGTPPKKVLAAVRNFAREEFGHKHRYAFALHTDEPHPHVHLVVKAVSEQGVRLNIRKETLRSWRSNFARHLRAQGVEANATERAVRGNAKVSKHDGIYRAALRGDSVHMRQRVEAIAREMARGDLKPDPGQAILRTTRNRVVAGWYALAAKLTNQDQRQLAQGIARFVERMPPPRTERAQIAEQLQRQLQVARARDLQPTR
jgi:hypothetical protein